MIYLSFIVAGTPISFAGISITSPGAPVNVRGMEARRSFVNFAILPGFHQNHLQ